MRKMQTIVERKRPKEKGIETRRRASAATVANELFVHIFRQHNDIPYAGGANPLRVENGDGLWWWPAA